MTRFEKEISGEFGAVWQKSAQADLKKVQSEYDDGKITVDENGVLRNCIGRVATREICEKCKYIGIAFDGEATERANREEVAASIAKYVAEQEKHETSDEELYEMRAAFGAGAVVTDVITGKTYSL